MEDSDHSRCSDDEHREVKPRECDDMLQRRLAGNMPAALRKKKIESSYKQYITPSGNPMEYVKKHMRSKSMSDMEVDPAKREEQMERSARYDELQKLKEQLKEEEESWSSNLQNWKSRRRSATFDVRKRKEDREVVQLEADNKSRRKTKTFKEIIEAKKQRDSELFDDIDVAAEPGIQTAQKQTPQISSSFDGMRNGGVVNVSKVVSKDTSKDGYTGTNKNGYTGTSKNGYTATSKDGYTATSNDGYTGTSKYSFTGPKKDGYTSTGKDGNTGTSKGNYADTSKGGYTVTSKDVSKDTSKVGYTGNSKEGYVGSRKDVYTGTSQNVEKINTKPTSTAQKMESSRPEVTYSSKTMVVLRNKQPAADKMKKERPKSAHVDLWSSRAATLPRDYHKFSGSKQPAVQPSTAFSQQRRSAFANKRNMWENIGSQTIQATPTAPKALSALLKDDVPIVPSSAPEPTQAQIPQVINRRSKSPTIPVHTNAISTAPVKPGNNELASKIVPTVPKIKATASIESLFDDMKICINQRPRSEKGFGFTVRGGDDGKPVIVNTVTPGGAANVCQLCIGDEILAINDVTLSSTLSQDEIVQLIVDSVITGNLGLDIRRYGKSKKQTGNPLRLSGTKVVMTPGGFVQVRSDKGLLVSTKPSTNNHTKHNQEQPSEHEVEPKQTKPTTKLLPVNNQDTPRSPKFQRPVGSRAQEAAPQRSNQISLDHPKPNPSTDAHAPQRFTGKPAMEHRNTLQDQLMEESQRLAEREAKLLQDKRKRIAEAKLEEARLEEELLKIENSKLEQQRKREEEKQRLVGDQNLGLPISTASYQQHGLSHWLIEEAERSRIAQQEGKSRSNPLQQNYKQSGSVLSDRLVERQTNPSVHASHYNHPPTSLNHIWNDPSAQATLL